MTKWPILQGMLVTADESAAGVMSEDPRVRFVEQNATGSLPRLSSLEQYVTYYNGQYLWHLDRLDEKQASSTDGTYEMCSTHQGHGVYAYLLDSGVWVNHPEFSGRSVINVNFHSGTGFDPYEPCSAVDTSGARHGTMVATVLAGNSIGVSRPNIRSLRIADCDGFFDASNIFNALSFIPTDLPAGKKAVVNFSGFEFFYHSEASQYSQYFRNFVNNTGIPVFTSADNYSTDASLFHPNDEAYSSTNYTGTLMVVGGTSIDDFCNFAPDPAACRAANPCPPDPDCQLPECDPAIKCRLRDHRQQVWVNGKQDTGQESGSNSGDVISIWAPSNAIYVGLHAGAPTQYAVATGTSFAAPIVAGLAARYQQVYGGTAHQVYDFLLSNATEPVEGTFVEAQWFCYLNAEPWAFVKPALVSNYPSGHPSCFPNYTEAYVGAQDSSAKMAHWEEGLCQ